MPTAVLPSLSRKILQAMSELGVDVNLRPDGTTLERVVPKEWWDTNDLQAVDTETNYFQTTRTAHTRKEGGCNLEQAGILSLNSDVLVVGVGVDVILAKDQADAGVDDVMSVRNYGLIREIRVKERRVMEPAFFTAFPLNRGFTLFGTGYDGTTPNVDQAVNGQPGHPSNGNLLAAPARFYVAAGERVDCPVILRAAGALAAAVTVRIHLFGVEIGTKGGTPNNA